MNGETCPKCGYQLQPFDKECPRCARLPKESETSRPQPPRDEDRIAPAPGQEHPIGSLGYLKGVIRADPLFAVLLGMLALGFLVNFLEFDILGMIFSFAIFWGVFTLRRWAFYFALALTGLNIILVFIALAFFPEVLGSTLNMRVLMVISLAINVFAIFVLITRRDYFA